MYWDSPDDVIQREIRNVRARRVIIEELETGPKTGTELREKIRQDMIEQAQRDASDLEETEVTVSDPKLYFNTKHLEEMGVIVSHKDSQHRVYELHPRAVQPVRRVLNVTRPTTVITSIVRPEDRRSLVVWFVRDTDYHFTKLVVIVESERFSKGVPRDLTMYVPDGTTRKWEHEWHELPGSVVGYFEGNQPGNLMATYSRIEKILLKETTENNIVLDLTDAPPLIATVFCMLANDYGITAIYLQKKQGKRTSTTHYIPGVGLM